MPQWRSYRALVAHLQVDTVILVDGGTDSLMRGDEAGLGTPEEDMTSIAAVDALDAQQKYLVCLGFGVDSFHGVCHAHAFEAVAEFTRQGAFLGAFSLLREMPEVQRYFEASEFVFEAMAHHPSIVSTSILSALEGSLVFDRYLFSLDKEEGTSVWDVATGERLLRDSLFCPLRYHRGTKVFLTVLPDGVFQISKLLGRTIEPSLLSWNDGTVVKLAQTIQEEGAFDCLPILADALVDAGCTDAEILSHCRKPVPHARTCWVIDLLLKRE